MITPKQFAQYPGELIERIAEEAQAMRSGIKWDSVAPTTDLAMNIAEMDFGIADEIRDALARAVHEGRVGYASQPQLDRLSDVSQEYFLRRFGWDFAASARDVTSDVSVALGGFVDAFVRPRSPIVVVTPAYSPLRSVPQALGHPVIDAPLVVGHGRYALDLETIGRALDAGAGAVLLCHPHNPTGAVFTPLELGRLAELVDRAGAYVFSDEVFGPLVFDDRDFTPYAAVSPAAASHSMTVISASKCWNVSGLRCAQLVLAPRMRAAWDAVSRARRPPPGALGVRAATAAFLEGADWLSAVRAHVLANVDVVCDTVHRSSRIRVVAPRAAYFCWFTDAVPGALGADPRLLLARVMGVETQGAQDFGERGASGFRLNIATSRASVATAAQRIAELFADDSTYMEQGTR